MGKTCRINAITAITICLITLNMLFIPSVQAEYRAYLIEVYDHIIKKKWEEKTGFSPDKYISTHGGGYRLSAFMKATWMCYGNTSGYIPACPMPPPIMPMFNVGERVRINLEKHITEKWIGIVELSYYQDDLKSNVYGVRFGDKRQMYNRYFEFNLEKVESDGLAQPNETDATENLTEP